MELIHVIEDLIKFRTETGNSQEIEKCLAYADKLFSGSGA